MKRSLKKSRLIGRLWIVFSAYLNRYLTRYLHHDAEKILIPTQLLLGDCILAISLIKKAIHYHPNSEIVVAAPAYAIDIYSKLNLSVTWVAWDQKNIHDLRAIKSKGPFKVAYIPFEKWGPLWAFAFGAREVIGFTLASANFHDRFLTKVIPIPEHTVPISDWLMLLIPGNDFTKYTADGLSLAKSTYVNREASAVKRVILHIGARNENRRWLAEHWNALAEKIRASGMQVIWTYAANEKLWAENVFKAPQDFDTAGELSFEELLSLINDVDAVVSPDTGVAHLCKLTATPNVVIYGQGNPAIHGNGLYWSLSPVVNIFISDIPCRSMSKIFGRTIGGISRCDLGPNRCANPYCQNTITSEIVMAALMKLLKQ